MLKGLEDRMLQGLFCQFPLLWELQYTRYSNHTMHWCDHHVLWMCTWTVSLFTCLTNLTKPRKHTKSCPTESKGVTTQMKALDEYFVMVVFKLLLNRVHIFANNFYKQTRHLMGWEEIHNIPTPYNNNNNNKLLFCPSLPNGNS